MITAMYFTCVVLFLLICAVLIGLVLLQKGRGGGLASAFGGAGGNTAFGSKTGDVLTWATAIIFGIFIVLAVALNLLATAKNNQANSTPAAKVSESAPQEAPAAPAPTSAPAAAPATPEPATRP